VAHQKVENKTPFVFAPLHLVDEEFHPLIVPVLKATFVYGRDGRCMPAEKQIPINVGGELWGSPEDSSYRYEPEVAFVKPATDVVLIGHAYATSRNTKEMPIGLRIGSLNKEVLVYGDRTWFKSGGSILMTRPLAFEKVPLLYERAFGGWDRSHPDPGRHACDPRNPVGTGFRTAGGPFIEGIRLPNLEDPRAPIRTMSDRPPPASFGFVSPHWHPRAALAGTFGEAWEKSRAPLLPKDFDRRHLNAASPGLIAPGYLRGDEVVTADGVSPEGRLSFALPGVPPPTVRVVLAKERETKQLTLALDTIIIEPDERRCMLIWRANLVLPTGPHDVEALEVSVDHWP
jgi:hypothetical protein